MTELVLDRPRGRRYGYGVFARGLAAWGVIIAAEALHGAARTLFLQPYVGDFRARQISVFTASVLVLAIAWAFAPWMRARTPRERLAVGAMWLGLTVAFEISLGRALGYSWERILSDYDLAHGGLMPIGLVFLALSPLIAARLRGMR